MNDKTQDNQVENEVEQHLDENEVNQISDSDQNEVTIEKQQEDALRVLEKRISELEDKNLRLLAEFNNYKKRSNEDLKKMKVMGKVEVFKKLVDTLDNFERALQQECGDQKFIDGMQLIYDKLLKDAQDLGLCENKTEGCLDHNIHQALSVIESDDYDDNQIVNVLQKGYNIDGILVRPSMVQVNKKPQVNNENEINDEEK